VSVALVSVGLIFMFGLLYLSQSNAIALKGYSLSELEKKKSELQEEKERLQIEATRLQSIQEIQKSSSSVAPTKYVPIQKINYLPTTNVAVK
jgi:vacuolar-type H+-ATPase subunit I/STV1